MRQTPDERHLANSLHRTGFRSPGKRPPQIGMAPPPSPLARLRLPRPQTDQDPDRHRHRYLIDPDRNSAFSPDGSRSRLRPDPRRDRRPRHGVHLGQTASRQAQRILALVQTQIRRSLGLPFSTLARETAIVQDGSGPAQLIRFVIARRISFFASFSFIFCRLSCSFRPLPTAISTFARPFEKYIDSGIIVSPS